MSKFSEVLATQHRSGVGKKVKDSLDPDSYKDLLVALGDKSIPIPTIMKALRNLEVPVSRAAVARWRNGEPPLGADMPIVKAEQE